MDINKDNEILQENTAEETTTADVADVAVTEEIAPEIEEVQEEVSEETEAADGSTLDVDSDDIDQECLRYGLVEEETAEPAKEPALIQKPILVAALAFLLTAVIILGTMFVYKALTKPVLYGTWSQEGDYNGNMFLKFEPDGKVALDMGGFERYGTYTLEEIQGYDVIHTDFYELALISKDIVATYSEDKNTMNLYFLYEGTDLTTIDLETTSLDYVAMGSIAFQRGEAPLLNIDPNNITHASADEFGITALSIDDSILGSWKLEIMGTQGKYETYTFNSDGTGSRDADYVYYETYACGLGETSNFKYTVSDGNILITYDYYDGTTGDQVLKYELSKGNLVIDGVGYEAAK